MAIEAMENTWLLSPRNSSDAVARLFCFPYAGAGASALRGWFDALPADIDVCVVQLPGRERRLLEPPCMELPILVERLGHALEQRLGLPFAFFGHSMGALIAFELAHHLRNRQIAVPSHIFVSGHRAPHLRSRRRPIHQLPEAEFIHELRRLKGTPEEVLGNAELMQLVMPALRADFMMCETYVYTERAALECPITAFGGTGDDQANSEEIAAWRQQTRGRFSLQMMPGDHFFPKLAAPAMQQAVRDALGIDPALGADSVEPVQGLQSTHLKTMVDDRCDRSVMR